MVQWECPGEFRDRRVSSVPRNELQLSEVNGVRLRLGLPGLPFDGAEPRWQLMYGGPALSCQGYFEGRDGHHDPTIFK